MGNFVSTRCVCSSSGAMLLVAAASGDVGTATELLTRYPRAAGYVNFKDKSSPLIQSAACGHFELLQLILETAVMTEGAEKAMRSVIDHANAKRQTALMVACKHGHADCVEYLITNGADPLLTDERRHNTCLHFAALYGHSDCINKLLGSHAMSRVQGQQLRVACVPCSSGGLRPDGEPVKYADQHNGWGLSALHIAVFQGSVSTVRALLRHGADLSVTIAPSAVDNSPIRAAVGSNVLHIAALTGNMSMAKVVLEAQDGVPGLELRSRANGAGLRPLEYATRSPVLLHLLDARLPVALLRQVWSSHALDTGLPPRTATLDAMLQKLKLMFNLELLATHHAATQAQAALDAAAGQEPSTQSAGGSSPDLVAQAVKQAELRALRRDDVTALLQSVVGLHLDLSCLRAPKDAPAGTNESSSSARGAAHEAVLDLILATLVTPRTVSAVLHAAKKLVAGSVQGPGLGVSASMPVPEPPGGVDSEAQHSMALLHTALRAVETCLQAAVFLTSTHPPSQASAAKDAAQSLDDKAAGTAAAAGRESVAEGGAASRSADPSSTMLPALMGQASVRAGAGMGGRVPAVAPSPDLMFQRPADPSAPPALTSHWSAHLHTLIAQLQWDIGVQRHRRRRAHITAAAARSATPSGGGSAVAVPAAGSGMAVSSSRERPSTHASPRSNTRNRGITGQTPSTPTTSSSRRPYSASHTSYSGASHAGAGRLAAQPQPSSTHTGISMLGHPASDIPLGTRLALVMSEAVVAAEAASSLSGCPAAVPEGLQDVQLASAPLPGPAVRQARPARSAPHAALIIFPAEQVQAGAGSPDTGITLPVHVSYNEISGPSFEGAASVGNEFVGLLSDDEAIVAAVAEEDASSAQAQTLPLSGALPRHCTRTTSKGDALEDSGKGGLVLSADEAEDDSSADSAGLSDWSEDEPGVCSICMDLPQAVVIAGCHHGLCVQCAFQLCMKGRELPCCPFCRQKIGAFEAKPGQQLPMGLAASATTPVKHAA